MNPTRRPCAPVVAMTTVLAAMLTVVLMSACGGGGDSGPGASGGTSAETAESVSANGMVVADDGVRAQATVLRTARSVVAVGSANQLVGCAGGGTALFTASAGTSGSLTNGVLDTGEAYSIQFFGCRSASGSASVTGTLNLSVINASGNDLSVSTSADVWVTLTQRTLRLNGNSTHTHSVQTTGPTQVVTDHWVSPLINTTSVRNNRATSLSLSDVNLTHTETTTNGVLTGSTDEGTVTMTYDGWLGRWSATIATQGLVSFDVNGVPLVGSWLITLPHDRIALQVANNLATAALDLGRNGSIERTFLWPVLVLAAAAD